MKLIMSMYTYGDEYDIMHLFKETFGKNMKLKYWNWRYKKSNQTYINLMWDDEKLIGHYALFPIEVIYKNRIVKAGFSMTTMTSNKYRNLGIFKKLANELYLKSYNDLSIIWGFPNDNSLNGFVKNLNWNHIFDINMMIINTVVIHKDVKVKNKNISETSEFSDKYNNLIDEVSKKYDFFIKRDKNYLNWRFVANPINEYHILQYEEKGILKGYCVYKIYYDNEKYFGDIVDIIALNKNIFKQLVLETILCIEKKHVYYANIWMVDQELRNILYDIGFEDSNIITHFGMRINTNLHDLNSIHNFKNYYLTMSDSDVF